MRIRLFPLVAAAPLALIATPGFAQTAERARPVNASMDLILAGDVSAAETRLHTALASAPDQPALLLNLAAVYARTDRADAARDAYAQVLANEEVWLELSNGRIAGSHMIARRGIARLDNARTAGR